MILHWFHAIISDCQRRHNHFKSSETTSQYITINQCDEAMVSFFMAFMMVYQDNKHGRQRGVQLSPKMVLTSPCLSPVKHEKPLSSPLSNDNFPRPSLLQYSTSPLLVEVCLSRQNIKILSFITKIKLFQLIRKT